jgi:hypothetical protein
MAFQKNFVVKNGLEVRDNLIFADNEANTVGIGTTIAEEKLQVNGGIGGTSIVLSGVGTIPTIKSTNALIDNGYINSGIVTSITGTGLTYTTGNFNILNATTGNIVSGVVTNLTGTISTYTTGNFTTGNLTTLNATTGNIVSGVVTNLSGTISTYTSANLTTLNATTGNIVSGVVTNLSGTISTYTTGNLTTLNATTGNIVSGIVTNLSGTISTYTTGNFTTLNATTGNIVSGVVTNLSGTISTYTSANLTTLNATTGNIVSGVVTNLSGTISTYTTGNFTTGNFTTGNLTTLNATTGNIVSGVVTNLSGTISTYTNSYSTTLNSGTVLTSNLYAVSGVVTSVSGSALNYTNISGSRLNVSGVSTVGSLSIGSTQIISSGRQLQNIVSLDSTTTSTVQNAITFPNSFTNIQVTGIATIGTVRINSGIISATSGVVTYYGDATYLQNIPPGNPSGSDTQVQYNNAGSFGASSNFTFNGGTVTVGSAVTINATGINANSGVITATTFVGSLSGNSTTATTATNANNINVADESADTTCFPVFTTDATGNQAPKTDSSSLTYNASAGTLSATNFSGTTATISGNSSGNIVRITQEGSGNALLVEDSANPDTTPFVVTGIGSVGIGTSAPINTLDVHGTLRLARQDSVSDGGEMVFARSSDNTNAWAIDVFGSGSNPNFRITDSTQSATRIHIGSGGNVGIGSTATSRLHVFGNANITGIITATQTSTVLTNYSEKINALGNTGIAATVNLANGNFVTATLTDNCTFTFTTGIGTGAQSFTLFLTNDATPSRTITWPVTVKWPGGSTPVRTETANKTDVYSFFTFDNGSNWYGTLSIYNYS